MLIAAVFSPIIGLLQWLYPRHPKPMVSPDNMSGDLVNGRTWVARKPPVGSVIWIGIGLIFFFVTVYLIVQLQSHAPAGPQGPIGQTGPIGPQGPAGPPASSSPDPRIAQLSEAIVAITKAQWLTEQSDKFEKLLTQYQAEKDTRLQGFTNEDGNYRLSMRLNTQFLFNPPSQAITEFAKRVLGMEIDMHKAPQFDRNHHCCAPSDTRITDPRALEDYNRALDETKYAEHTIESVRQKLNQQLTSYRDTIDRIGESGLAH